MKLSPARAKYFLKDETKASRQYKALGFPRLARDEARHAKFFKGKLKKGF